MKHSKEDKMLPKDPVILLSFVNTKLRDDFDSLDKFCKFADCSKEDIILKLKEIGYFYNEKTNQFK